MRKCTVYKNRPCKSDDFPYNQTQLGSLKCGFTFEKGTRSVGDQRKYRKGECNKCGKCCFLHRDMINLGDEFVAGFCPYLGEEE
jgi:hypothetical protein